MNRRTFLAAGTGCAVPKPAQKPNAMISANMTKQFRIAMVLLEQFEHSNPTATTPAGPSLA